MAATPQAVWFTKGTPAEVKKSVQKTMLPGQAHAHRSRCSSRTTCRSATARSTRRAARRTPRQLPGVDRRVRGRHRQRPGDRPGRARRPRHHPLVHVDQRRRRSGASPPSSNPATAASDRFTQVNGAVDRLTALPNTSVYLDGTHSGWLGVGDISDRLHKAGVEKADGFFLNVSNYETTERQAKYASWISQCLWYGTNTAEGGWRVGHFDYCASQYYPATPGDFSTWGLTDQWYIDERDQRGQPAQRPGRPGARASSTPAATARVRGPRPAEQPRRRPAGLVQPARTAASA